MIPRLAAPTCLPASPTHSSPVRAPVACHCPPVASALDSCVLVSVFADQECDVNQRLDYVLYSMAGDITHLRSCFDCGVAGTPTSRVTWKLQSSGLDFTETFVTGAGQHVHCSDHYAIRAEFVAANPLTTSSTAACSPARLPVSPAGAAPATSMRDGGHPSSGPSSTHSCCADAEAVPLCPAAAHQPPSTIPHCSSSGTGSGSRPATPGGAVTDTKAPVSGDCLCAQQTELLQVCVCVLLWVT